MNDFHYFLRHYEQGGSTLLHIASRYAHLEIAKYLIEKIQSIWGREQQIGFVNAIDNSNHLVTPLIELARSHNGDIKDKLALAELLIEKGALLIAADKNGNTPLHWAVKVSNLPLVKLFLKHFQKKSGFLNKLNSKNQTALNIASILVRSIIDKQKAKDFQNLPFHPRFASKEILALLTKVHEVFFFINFYYLRA